MRKRLIWLAPLILLGFAAFIALGGEIVRQLWNWLVPGIFGWKTLTFWQALGLLALCRILFGSLGMGSSGRSRMRQRMAERWDQRMAERWEKMTPEEREKYRSRRRNRYCDWEPPPGP